MSVGNQTIEANHQSITLPFNREDEMVILCNALILMFIVYFIKSSTWPGMIWAKQHDYLEEHLPEKLYKPIIGCPVCMTPWWGLGLYMAAHFLSIRGFEDARAQSIVFTLFCAAGMSTVVLMLNKEYDVAKKEDKLLEEELEEKGIEK